MWLEKIGGIGGLIGILILLKNKIYSDFQILTLVKDLTSV